MIAKSALLLAVLYGSNIHSKFLVQSQHSITASHRLLFPGIKCMQFGGLLFILRSLAGMAQLPQGCARPTQERERGRDFYMLRPADKSDRMVGYEDPNNP